MPPNVFKFKASCKCVWTACFFQQCWISCKGGCAESRPERGWRSRPETGGTDAVFSATLGVCISPPPSASDALKDRWQQTARSNATLLTELVDEQCVRKKSIFILKSCEVYSAWLYFLFLLDFICICYEYKGVLCSHRASWTNLTVTFSPFKKKKKTYLKSSLRH